MNRLISAALGGAFLAANAGMALAAGAPASAPAVSSGTSATATHPGAAAAAVRHGRAGVVEARMTHALNLLEANGYGDFANFRQDGKNFDATVTRNGRPTTVVVDPDANQVSRQG